MRHVLGKHTLLAAVAIAALAGCGGSGEDSEADDPTPSAGTGSPSPTFSPTAAQGADQCGLLTDDEVQALAGERLDDTHETLVGGQLPACIWGSLNDVGVQAGRTDPSRWARSLPEVVDVLRTSGLLDAEDLRKLDEAAELIESGRTIPAGEACDLFSSMVEANGRPAGSDWTVNVVPSVQDPQAITGQACRDGSYATVLLVRPDLAGSPAEARRVRSTLETVLHRPAR